jgi:hypothetical protein
LTALGRGRPRHGGYRVPRRRKCRAEADALAAQIALSGKRWRAVQEHTQHRCTAGAPKPACFYGP